MEWIHSISSIGDLHMKTEYYVRVLNSLMANSLEYEFAIANKKFARC